MMPFHVLSTPGEGVEENEWSRISIAVLVTLVGCLLEDLSLDQKLAWLMLGVCLCVSWGRVVLIQFRNHTRPFYTWLQLIDWIAFMFAVVYRIFIVFGTAFEFHPHLDKRFRSLIVLSFYIISRRMKRAFKQN